ncbi:MAG: sigma-70 family RNA polymerase sigma factor [Bryobacteraceae bacterium]|nr:sigma-70 family RNA polymerase sigma factor [Bryobacteraceae bacterium]
MIFGNLFALVRPLGVEAARRLSTVAIDEPGLVLRTQAGDDAAFDVLYGRHQPPVYRYALRMSGSPKVADEVVQEVFLGLIHGARGYDAKAGPLRSYLYGMARHALARQRRGERDFEELGEDLEANGDDPLAGLAREEQVERVRGALAALPAHYREVVVFCEMEELSYAETAEVLGVAVGTVRSRLSRAKSLLLKRLSRQGVEA